MRAEETRKPILCIVDRREKRWQKLYKALLAEFAETYLLGGQDTYILDREAGDMRPLNPQEKLPVNIDVFLVHSGDKNTLYREIRTTVNPGYFFFEFSTYGEPDPDKTKGELGIYRENSQEDISKTDNDEEGIIADDIKQLGSYVSDPENEPLPDRCYPEKDDKFYWRRLGNKDIKTAPSKKEEIQRIFDFLQSESDISPSAGD